MEEQIKPVAYAFAQDFSKMEHECRLIPAYQVERGDFCSDMVPLYSQQSIDALSAEVQWAMAAVESKAGWEWKKRAERAEAEAESLRADAERYRWLRDGGLGYLPYDDHGCGPEYPHHDELDAAIDQARGKGVGEVEA